MPKGLKGFQKGNKVGGNVPKMPLDVKALFLAEAPNAVLRLIELSKCTNRPVAIKANELILAYAIGKPVQPIGNDDNKPFKIQVETVNLDNIYELNKQNNT